MAKKLASDTAEFAGNIVGVGEGALHSIVGLGEGAVFLGRLAARDRRAWDQLDGAAIAAVDYARSGVAEPESVVRDGKAIVQRMRTQLDPHATPEAAASKDELRRRFEIGKNQGELAFDAGTALVGGPLAKSVKGLARNPEAAIPERYVAQGFRPETAAYLAEPYPRTGRGSHWVPLRSGLPRSYLDSEFNVLKPPGIARGEMLEEHFKIDDRFWGARLPARFGEHWSGKRLRLQRYGPAARVWRGTPAPLKARVGGSSAAAGGVAYELSEEDVEW